MMRHRLNTSRVGTATLLIAAIAALTPSPAHAQEGVASTSPTAGTVVVAPPPVVTMMMKKAVTRAEATAIDGCGRVVPGSVVVAGARVSLRLAIDHLGVHHEDHSEARGAWRVNWRTVGTGGLAESGQLAFTLAGEPRCDIVPQPVTHGSEPTAPVPDVRDAALTSASPPMGLLAPLFAVAGLGVLLAFARVLTRRRVCAPSAR